MTPLIFVKAGNVTGLRDWVGRVGFTEAFKHVAKRFGAARAKKIVGKLKGMANRAGTLAPEHAYGATTKAEDEGADDDLLAKGERDDDHASPKDLARAAGRAVDRAVTGAAPEAEEMLTLAKAGPGSRGGRVIGTTRSGKPIYDRFDAPGHAKFSEEDHRDAAQAARTHAGLSSITRGTNDPTRVGDALRQALKHGHEARKGELEREPTPAHLPEGHSRYFHHTAGTQHIPLDKLHGTKGPQPKSEERAAKLMARAAAGKGSRRMPITVRPHPKKEGHYQVVDGNATHGAAKRYGWSSLPAIMAKAWGSRGGTVIGSTSSGKPIYERPEHPAHRRFTPVEHRQAAALHSRAGRSAEAAAHTHAAAVARDRPSLLTRVTGGLARLGVDTSAVQDEFAKARGEGSRGGHVIGHKKSGKPKYGPPSSIAHPPSRPGWDAGAHPKERCADCGARAEEHRQSDGLCPPSRGGWGQPHEFPSGRGRTDQEFDAAIAAHWGGSKTFKPMAKAHGEGSRGGQIVGHFRTGRAKYGPGRTSVVHYQEKRQTRGDVLAQPPTKPVPFTMPACEAKSRVFEDVPRGDWRMTTTPHRVTCKRCHREMRDRLQVPMAKAREGAMTKMCTKCNKAVVTGDKHCTTCGTKLMLKDGAVPAEAHEAEPARHRLHMKPEKNPVPGDKHYEPDQDDVGGPLDGDEDDAALMRKAVTPTFAALLAKALRKGPGSRGGKLIGYTRSGKPVYEGREADHPAHQHWSKDDHLDASSKHDMHAGEHRLAFEEASKEAEAKHGRSGWGRLEGVMPRGTHYPPDVHRSIYEPHRRMNRERDIAKQHRELAARPEKRAAQAASIRQSYEEAEKYEGKTRAEAQAAQSEHAKGQARVWRHATAHKWPPFAKASGEGAHGGHIIGHTKSGKPIYAAHGHPDYDAVHRAPQGERGAALHQHMPDFTNADHHDATTAHMDHGGTLRMGSPERHSADLAAQSHVAAARHVRQHTPPTPPEKKPVTPQLAPAGGGLREPPKPKRQLSFSETLQRNLDKHKKKQEANVAAMREARARAEAHRAATGEKPPAGMPEGAISLSDLMRKAGGEGARGGQIVGHTRSGKAVYLHGSHEAWKAAHQHFSPEEHRDARNLHAEAANRAGAGDIQANHKHSEHVRWHQGAILDHQRRASEADAAAWGLRHPEPAQPKCPHCGSPGTPHGDKDAAGQTWARCSRKGCQGRGGFMVKARQPKLGTGARFAELKEKLGRRKGKVRNPGALAAYIGRKKYGKKKFAQLAKGVPLGHTFGPLGTCVACAALDDTA